MKRNVYSTMFTGVVLASAAVFIGACAHSGMQGMTCPPDDLTRDLVVKIEFDDNKCPKPITCDNPGVSKAKRVIWESSDAVGNKPDYEIYFDPFKGQPLTSTNGVKRSPPFDSNTPAGEYKYTIVGTECRGKPLDPRFRLR
jgi:hypothetical protein